MVYEVTGGEPFALISAVVVRSGKVALVAGSQDRWVAQPGYTLVPLELPGGALNATEPPHDAVSRHCRAALGVEARPLASHQLFGPSESHRMDKLSAAGEVAPIPLLRFERAVLRDSPTGDQIGSIVVRSYLARIEDEPTPAEPTCGILWSPLESLSALLRGIPLAEFADLPRGADWLPNPIHPLPAEAFFYMPSELGERHLARLIAKYGRGVLSGEEM